MLRLFLIFLTFLFASQLFADSFYLVINGKAIHEVKNKFNEENWGLGFEYNFREKRKWINFANGGYFKDSKSNISKYFGGGSKRRFMLGHAKDSWHFDAGYSVFFMTRKDVNNHEPFLGFLPFISLGTNKFSINATYIPSIKPKSSALIFFQASIKLSQW